MEKNPFESNNGLRVTGRTYKSISLEWPEIVTLVSYGENIESSETESGSENHVGTTEGDSSSHCSEEVQVLQRNGNWTDLQMRRNEDGWKTIYKGYGKTFTVNGLPPDLVVEFRMKRNHETEWGSEVIASTSPSPATVEDLNRAVETNSEYLVSRIFSLTRPEFLKKIVTACDRNGMTPLMMACHMGNGDIAKQLIDMGSDVNGKSPGTWRTPLIYATIMGHKNIVLLLNRFKADWRSRDRSGCSALDYAIQSSNLPILRMAFSKTSLKSVNDRSNNRGWSPLMRAAILSDNLDILRFLISKGADPNSRDIANNKSVLHAAVLSKKPVFVKYLLQKGADPTFKNVQGKTCIEIAKLLGYREITEILTSHSASVARY